VEGGAGNGDVVRARVGRRAYKHMYIVPRPRWLSSRFQQNAACSGGLEFGVTR
jgi:hypothetical protein